MPVGHQDKTWASHVACQHRKKTLEGWNRGKNKMPGSLLFLEYDVNPLITQPTVASVWWILPNTELGKMHLLFIIQTFFSSIAPVPHSVDLPVPTPPERSQPSEEISKSENEEYGEQDYDLTDVAVERNPYYPHQTSVTLSEILV
ncbi:uncharacterized protein [Cherax quadricarinatus]|uniref:uncharacterized protein n=1 Tax=Cherax quadricarinatus TaxID=27406 RepID=UPI00387EDF87